MSTKAVRVRVTGDVQGVFFRDACAERAREQGVSGWVSNESDSSVAGHFEGDPGAVDALVDWCRSGSPRATVDDVEVDDAEPSGASGFETR